MNTLRSTADIDSVSSSFLAPTHSLAACARRIAAALSAWARAVLLLPLLLVRSFATHAATRDIGLPAPATGYSTANFANNFPYNGFAGCVGAAGMAFDAAGNLFVVDETNGNL